VGDLHSSEGGEAVDERIWVQVTAHYVAMTPNGRVFDSSLDRGFPYDIRVGSGQVTAMHIQIPCIFDSVSTTWCLKSIAAGSVKLPHVSGTCGDAVKVHDDLYSKKAAWLMSQT